MHELIEFIKWCFKDSDSTFATIIVLGMIFTFIYNVISLFTPNKPKSDWDGEEDEDEDES